MRTTRLAGQGAGSVVAHFCSVHCMFMPGWNEHATNVLHQFFNIFFSHRRKNESLIGVVKRRCARHKSCHIVASLKAALKCIEGDMKTGSYL